MSLCTSKSIRSRALAGLITTAELAHIEAKANKAVSVRGDAARAIRDALMMSWKVLYSDLGDPYEYKQKWDERAENNRRTQNRVAKYASAIMEDISPAIASLADEIQTTSTIINPSISSRYSVTMA